MGVTFTWFGHATIGLDAAGKRILGPDDALRAACLLQPRHVIPVHYNTRDLIAQDPHAWADQVLADTSAIPHVLAPGGQFRL